MCRPQRISSELPADTFDYPLDSASRLIGYLPVSVLASIVGLMSALMLGNADPATWMIPIAGALAGTVLLGFLVLANASSLVGMIQGSCSSLIQHLGPRMQALGWPGASMAIPAGGALVILFASEALLEPFFTIVAFVQAIYAGTAGVILTDRAVLRRGAVSLTHPYRKNPASDYRFCGGLNPFAFAAIACVASVYLLLMNPPTFDTAPLHSKPARWLIGAANALTCARCR